MNYSDIHKASGEECQAYVREYYPLAYLHGHGPECTIIAATPGHFPPELVDTHRYTLGRTIIIDPKASRELQKPLEDYLWRVAASIVNYRASEGLLPSPPIENTEKIDEA